MPIITIFAIATWWFTPEEKWLSKEHIKQILETPWEGNAESHITSKIVQET